MANIRHQRRKERLMAMFDRHGLRPTSRKGQNFLLDKNQVNYIARLGKLEWDDLVVEVGPGTGFLSQEILPSGCQLLAVELDHGLANLLRIELEEYESNLELIEADVLKGKNRINPIVLDRIREKMAEIGPQCHLKSVANLPYSAGTPFAMNLFSSDLPWERAVFLLQLEVGQRMAARVGHPAYGTLSITCALGGKVKVERKVPPQVFWPRPRVTSAVVSIEFHSLEERMKMPWKSLRRITSAVFSSRRKHLRNSLKGVFPKETLDATLASLDLDPKGRGEAMTPEEFLGLAWELEKSKSQSD